MGVAGDIVLTCAGCCVVFCAPLKAALSTLLGFWLLVPGSLWVPYAPHVAYVNRVVLVAFALRLLLRAGRPGEPSSRAYALTPIHAGFAAVVLVGFFDGVVLAPRQVSLAGDLHGLLAEVDLLVLFVVVSAVARTVGVMRVAGAISALLGIVSLITLVEWSTGFGWSRFFFEHLPAGYVSYGADPLGMRGSHVRSQAAAQFALELGWVAVVLLPLTIVVTVKRYRERARMSRPGCAIPVGVAVSCLLTSSRSAEIALAVSVLVLLAVSGFGRRMVAWATFVLALVACYLFVEPSVVTRAFAWGAVDPVSVRADRLPELFAAVTHRPFVGRGFSGVIRFGGIDNAYAVLYATLGVLGIVAWVALLVVALTVCARALRGRAGSDERMMGAATVLGILSVAMACSAYDAVSTTQTPWALAVLAALGACNADPGRLPSRRRAGSDDDRARWGGRVVLLPVAGCVAGFVVLVAAPVSYSEHLTLMPLAPWVESLNGSATDFYTGSVLAGTACGIAREVPVGRTGTPGASVTCLPASSVEKVSFPGTIHVTVRARTAPEVTASVSDLLSRLRTMVDMTGGAATPLESGRPAWALTAPLWMAVAGFLIGARGRSPGTSRSSASRAVQPASFRSVGAPL